MHRRALFAVATPLAATLLALAVDGCKDDPPTSSAGDASIGSLDATIGNEDARAVEPVDDAGAPGADADAGGEGGAAKTSGALQFDGIDDRVTVTMANGGANETAFTIELWFKTSVMTGTFFEVEGSGADRFIFLSAGKVCFYVYAAPYNTVCSTSAGYADGAWHHAAGTLGAVGGTRVYVDGALAGSDALPIASTFTADSIFSLGFGHVGFSSATNHFAGALDDVRVWSVERSAAEIVAAYHQTIDPTTPGLQVYWKLDETGAATTAVDSTIGAHNGTLGGFASVTSPWVGPGAL